MDIMSNNLIGHIADILWTYMYCQLVRYRWCQKTPGFGIRLLQDYHWGSTFFEEPLQLLFRHETRAKFHIIRWNPEKRRERERELRERD